MYEVQFFEGNMIFTAITGSIGCGKTTISGILRDLGYLVYDIDKWVRYLYYKKDFLREVADIFPEVFDNGIFNKKKLRNIVFDNHCKLKELEKLIHPFLEEKLRNIIRHNNNKGVVFVDVALLYEMKWDKYFDITILADVDEEKQKKRVMERDNISAEDFYKINNLQMPMSLKKEKVDFIIDTGVDINKLRRKTLDLLGVLEYNAEC